MTTKTVSTPPTRRNLLGHATGAVAAMTIIGKLAPIPTPDPDKKLMEASRRFDVAMRTERKALQDAIAAGGGKASAKMVKANALSDKTEAVAAELIGLPALTFAGLLTKYRVLDWYRTGDDCGLEIFGYLKPDAKPAADERAIVSILADLRALATEYPA